MIIHHKLKQKKQEMRNMLQQLTTVFWKIEAVVDVKCQKQPSRRVLKIFIEIFGKLIGFLKF